MSSNNRLMKIYTDTILDTKELLTPEQMDNDIINHIISLSFITKNN